MNAPQQPTSKPAIFEVEVGQPNPVRTVSRQTADAPGSAAHAAAARTAASRTPAVRALAASDTPFALSFAGQSLPWQETLGQCIAAGATTSITELLNQAEAKLRPIATRLEGQRPYGLSLLEWAANPDSAPSAAVLGSPAISVPGIVAAQLAQVEALRAQGLNLDNSVAPIGHSQGVLGAVAVEKPEQAADILALAQIIGVACARHSRMTGLTRQGDGAAAGPMMEVSGPRPAEVEPYLAGDAVIGLINGRTKSVVVGSAADLKATESALLAAAQRDAQAIEAKQRGGSPFAPVCARLDVDGGFHHPALATAVDEVVELATAVGIDGTLARDLAQQVLVHQVNWPVEVDGAVAAGAQVIIEVGPGAGVASLTRRAVAGLGIAVISAATTEGHAQLFQAGAQPQTPTWWRDFAPQVIARRGRTPQLVTAFTRLTGRSPILLGGMTPTTVDPAIVAAAANAGYWAELAGGGQVTPDIFHDNVARLHELLDEGASAQFNTMFLDPYLWGMHIGSRRLVQRAVAAGRPIDGVTISAGVPEVDEAVALIRELRAGGIPHVSFKPGTVKQIRSVLQIADAAAEAGETLPIIIQVEGGRAGGHHSWEELDDLLLATYSDIRQRDNVVLAVGGGIGKPEQAAEYLLGHWSQRHGAVDMPVDAIIIGTAAMAAKESTASAGVKQLLVDTAGTDDWVAAGSANQGMASGRSQLGADIHEIDNSAARAGRLLDEVAGDAEAVQTRRDEIITAINATAKPYFGDVDQMSYRELLARYLELAAPTDDEFIDPSWATRFIAIVDRAEARLSTVDAGELTSIFDTVEHDRIISGELSGTEVINRLGEHYDLDVRLHPADVTFFLTEVCRTPGKPVNFVPVIDADVRRWWRSDSLWQAHDDRYDADGVCIIPGIRAVSGIVAADEPVAEILARFEQAAIEQLSAVEPADDAAGETTVDAAGAATEGADNEAADQNLLERVLTAPTIWWAGRQQANPVQLLGNTDQWVRVDKHVEHVITGAQLAVEPVGAAGASPLATGSTVGHGSTTATRYVNLTVPLTGSSEDIQQLSLRMTVTDRPGAMPVVVDSDAADAMRALTTIAAGGVLPQVVDGIARWESTWTSVGAADHDAVTGATSATAPDALVGHAWPAIFASVAGAKTEGGVEVVEGMLALVHLEHHIRLFGELPEDGTELAITSHVDDIADTEMGRVVLVRAEIRAKGAVLHDGTGVVDNANPGADANSSAATDGTLIATLSERFAIRGRNGNATALVNTVPLPTVHDAPRSHRATVTVTAPTTLVPFATVTGDRNPIHVDERAAALAGLPGVIVHGMWLSAAAEHAAVSGVSAGQGNRITEFTATMLKPVLPGQEVTFTVERRGVDDRVGNGEVREVVATVEGEPVLTATAVIAQPTTCYVFPGQGIQSQGMGLAARTRCAAARAVWDEADRMTREKLGFSVLAIVRDNPTEVVAQGQRFFHPEGVLNLTQFTQVSMATLGLAQAAELREAGVLDEQAYFAGHSVGEYNALAAFAGVLDAAAVLEIVYRRGLTMHSLVPRDSNGRSNYGLSALRPDKIGVAEDEVTAFVADVAKQSGEFLEVVNLNLAGKQYAVAGTVAGLAALEAAALQASPDGRGYVRIPGIDVPFHSSVLSDGVDEFRGHLDRLLPPEIDASVLVGRYIPNLTATCFELTETFVRQMTEVVSSAVLDEILADFTAAAANPNRLARTLLVELLAWQFCSPVRWIETQDLLFDALGVTRLIEIGVGTAPTLANMASRTAALPRHEQRDITILNVERDADVVFAREEIQAPEVASADEGGNAGAGNASAGAGAGNTGTGGAAASAATPAAASDAAANNATNNTADAATAASAPAAAPAVATSAERPADITVSPADAVEILIALWTKVRPDQMGAADSIETLVDGVSSRRNQLLLDLGSEFGLGAIDGAADAELPALKNQVSGMVRGYSAFGPVLSESIADGLRRVTGPAGVRPNYVADRVTETWDLGEGWAVAVSAELVLGTREGASLRGGDLGHLSTAMPTSTSELDALIDAAVAAVGSARGVNVTMPATGGAAGGVIDSAALGAFAEQVTGHSGVLAVAARTILRELGHQETGAFDFDATDADAHLVDLVTAELGSDWPKLVTPAFDARKAVLLDDRWASSREDLARMWSDNSFRPTSIAPAAVAQAQWWARRADTAGKSELAGAYQSLIDAAGHAQTAHDTFVEDIAVVTGGSPDSIAAAVIAELLAGGATVIATTSRLNHQRLTYYRELYRTHATENAKLWVVPANLTSYQDLDQLIEWIGTEQRTTVGANSVVTKPALVPTLLFPFAAPAVSGSLADAGPAAEMQMRLLLWSVERLIAGLSGLGGETNLAHRLHIVLPGSPNRGRFGGDGAYGESKAALDALVNRWNVEKQWADTTSIAHAHIGWVRGTGLMGGNDPLVDAVEAKGVRTFSTQEMAAELMSLASEKTRRAAAQAPVTVDLTGGLGDVDLNMSALAAEAAEAAEAADAAADAAARQTAVDDAAAHGQEPDGGGVGVEKRGAVTGNGDRARNLQALPSPRLPIVATTPQFSQVDVAPEDMVVIVGAGELGPYGSSRTRFEAEVGEISAAGIVELAWTMGLISYDGGWLDDAGQPLAEEDIAPRYRDEVLSRVGVRRYGDDGDLIDNTMTELTTIYLDRDLSFPVRDRATAETFIDSDPEHTTARPDAESGEWIVTRAKGTPVQVPRRMAMSRYVGGQIPEGFDPSVYGIPADMMDNLDRVSLWNLVCTVDAFLASGFSPAELLTAVHPGLVSSTQGTGIGAMESLRSLYIDGILGQPRANDVLQEALPNVIAAHVMQSYVGGYGQMVHPVAACATAAVSVEEGVDKISLGKADFVVAGGFDDLSTEGITGFGDMAATADSAVMDGKGIDRAFFSRPNDRRRGGFVESQGGGTILLARGSLARELGLPVLGVVAFAESFADGAHTSIPAPGLGALGAARGGERSRLARQLAAHGVAADEVSVISKHDTSTNANDPNESELHERLADALGRESANPLFVVSQKSLTGHAKGGAAAFQMIGLTQVLREGIIPANRSLDCVDPALARHGRLVWSTQPINFGEALPLKAGLVTSLGFGHVSALVAIVHPEVFYQALATHEGEAAAADWRERATARETAGLRRIDDAIYGGSVLYERPEGRRLADGGSYPNAETLEKAMLINPQSRLVAGVFTDNPTAL